ncbi:DUF5753 domain-containing protein [Actinomadura rifamycini]|uniref:DUF5753 domain-containing protein n=1 Tax=Actinomadura rifamycini TaxID=31962 RepID=UPI0012FB5E8A|nr:DUF5753 domain-containing protein [Actinomadura rifamycini]
MDKGRIYCRNEVIRVLAYNRDIVGAVSFTAIDQKSRELEETGHRVCGVQVERVPRSTANDLWRKPAGRVPRWELLESLWATLYRLAEERGRDTSAMITLDELRDRHRRIDAPPVEAVAPGQGGRGADGRPAGAGISADSWQAAEAGLNVPRFPAGVPVPGVQSGRYVRDVDDQFIDELRRRGHHAPWRTYQDAVPDWFELYVTAEPELAEIRTYAPRRIPSLLQTGEYARLAIAADLPNCSDEALQRRVELRLCRQEILHRPDAPKLWIVFHEGVLREDLGSRPVLRAQVRHLLTLAEQRNITIQVIPADRASRAVEDGPLTIMRFPDSHINDMVFLEHRTNGFYVTHKPEVSYLAAVFSTYLVEALPPCESVRFLRELI